ncbi:MAG: 2OG-Fe(II) oxygenase family protein [Thiohalocapsa sp.]|nr:2OG-Fe(II) oxygenase family protein [Thiohalocapsa sp.]MCF7992966.1 2OG-Fe(II) oxygenase family protein [Thiohalocapsa sp.]
MPVQQIGLIEALHIRDFATVNRDIMSAFERLDSSAFSHRSHFVDGRFENLYLPRERLPGVSLVLDTALTAARERLGRCGAALPRGLRCGFWLNLMEPGHRTSRHHHDEDDELVSGVYYVDSPPNSGDIIFHDAPFEIRVAPAPGLMLLFPPSLEHSVTENNSGARRLSIAFNIGPDH